MAAGSAELFPAHADGRSHGDGLPCAAEDVVDGLVHAEEVEEGAAVDAEETLGRQEAGEVLDAIAPVAAPHQADQMKLGHEHVRLAEERFVGIVEILWTRKTRSLRSRNRDTQGYSGEKLRLPPTANRPDGLLSPGFFLWNVISP